MSPVDLVDKVLALVAMLVVVRPIVASSLGTAGQVSWRRWAALGAGGAGALAAVVGLLVVRKLVLSEEAFYLPTALGGALTGFGGMLGVAVLLARRPPGGGMSEDAAIHHATLAGAMAAFLAAPVLVLGLLGLTRLGRACLPWTVTQGRWIRAAEGVVLLALCLLPRGATVGGLRQAVSLFGSS